MIKIRSLFAVLALTTVSVRAAESLRNDRYALEIAADGDVTINVAGMSPQRLRPEFTVLWTEADPLCLRNPSHPNYPVAPRNAVRWHNPNESLEALNEWVGSPEFRHVTGMAGKVMADGKNRLWEFRDSQGHVTVRVTGRYALDTTRPLTVGQCAVMQAERTSAEGGRVRWVFAPSSACSLAAELHLPAGQADPELAYTLTPKREAFFSVVFTGAPEMPLAETLPVPQECAARGHKQFDFVMSEADLHLPRAHVATRAGNVALVADPRECRFRLPTIADSRFGFLLQQESGTLKPVLLAPLLGGAESKMQAGETRRFVFRCVVRAGDWKETYTHLARDIHGFRDQRDNSGPGSLNAALEHVLDFLANRRGGNHALWDAEQKYYDYFTDKTGVFKPFSPLYGLSAAIVTDDEEFFRQRARPSVEYALSRKTSVFAPYDNADNKQANSAGRRVGAPYLGYAQLVSLDAIFQRRTVALRALAEAREPPGKRLSDALARWQLTGEANALDAARALGSRLLAKPSALSEEDLFDLLDLADATREPRFLRGAVEAAYHQAAKVNLYPAPPDTLVTVDRGGLAPVHQHSFGRHRNVWGFPPPQPVRVVEQTVPAWRVSRLGLPGIAYPIEYWMNTHGALMRTAGLAHDDLLRDIARGGMVGRFGNYPGDNRSQDSLIGELPDAVHCMPWDWNFATVNPGHAWDFAGALLDFLVSDAFERSRGAIDFPALSAAGSHFRVRLYGGKPGRFYGDEGVHLWLPRGLVAADNRQFDWLAAHGNGQLYLALWSQSFQEESVRLVLDRARVQCDQGREARVWRENVPGAPIRVTGNQLAVTVAPKGLVAFAIPATVKSGLQARLYDPANPPLGLGSYTQVAAPFGPVHAMLLRAGRGLTSAFVYAETLPERVIGARLVWRQGKGAWQSITDQLYPYEFSPELRDDGGDFYCVFEIEDSEQRVMRSPWLTLAMGDRSVPPTTTPPEFGVIVALAKQTPATPDPDETGVSDDFVKYLQRAANPHDFGLRSDDRFYPYSTPQGRRIAWRQPVWDKALFARGCRPQEAEQQLRADVNRTLVKLKTNLAAREPPVDFRQLDRRQQETLLDFAHTEGVAGLRPELVSAVLGRDWNRLINQHLYVRYAGHAPDHVRNKAFAERWVEKGRGD
jgi:hypothetical protein